MSIGSLNIGGVERVEENRREYGVESVESSISDSISKSKAKVVVTGAKETRIETFVIRLLAICPSTLSFSCLLARLLFSFPSLPLSQIFPPTLPLIDSCLNLSLSHPSPWPFGPLVARTSDTLSSSTNPLLHHHSSVSNSPPTSLDSLL